jgi:proline dehydrogenase
VVSAEALKTEASDEDALEADVVELGRRLDEGTRVRARHRAIQDRALARLESDPQLRDALFRLVDVAPACAGPRELAEHFDALVGDTRGPTRLASLAAGNPVSQGAAGRLMLTAVRRVAKRFIVGETVSAAVPRLRQLWERGVAVSLDLLGEASVSLEEARAYAERCEEALSTLTEAASRWPERPLLERDAAGPISRVNLSVKVTALTPLVRPESPERGRDDLAARLRQVLRRARDLGAHLHVDMESVDTLELTRQVVLDLLGEPEFAEGPSAGLVVQAYLRDADDLLEKILERAEGMQRSTPLTIRLVKGAYWDHETIEAVQNGWIPPVWDHKYECDRCFERLSRRLIDAYPLVRPAIGSHNLRSVAHAVSYARRSGLRPADLELQVLRGLGDDLQAALAAEELRVRAYCPVGDMVEGMGYLVRRLLENSSNESFLARRESGVSIEELLVRP